jgi:hypothetical protein
MAVDIAWDLPSLPYLYSPFKMYWIYLLPSTQQTIGCNGFYNDMFRLTRVIVRLCSDPLVLALVLLRILNCLSTARLCEDSIIRLGCDVVPTGSSPNFRSCVLEMSVTA